MREETFVKNGSAEGLRTSTEIVGNARRRRFNTSYINRILKKLDEAPHGEGGKILRREGLYTKQISNSAEPFVPIRIISPFPIIHAKYMHSFVL